GQPQGAEASLSRRLRTPPLPATHAAVGNSWQNRRLCQSLDRTAVTSATSCRTNGWFGATGNSLVAALNASTTTSREHQQGHQPKDRQADRHLDGIQPLEAVITTRAVSPARPEARIAGMPRAIELPTLRAGTNRRLGAEMAG